MTLGYRATRITEKKIKKLSLGLNAVGRPYGDNFDPNYRMKYRPRRYAPGGGSVTGISPERWDQMCVEAAANWAAFMGGAS